MLTSYLVKCPHFNCNWSGSLLPSRDTDSWRGSVPTANGQKFLLAYDITDKPTAADQLQLGGQAYDFDSGRFFLIDLRQDPVAVVQLKEKIVPLLPSYDPTETELKTAIDTLQARQEKVRAFLDTPH